MLKLFASLISVLSGAKAKGIVLAPVPLLRAQNGLPPLPNLPPVANMALDLKVVDWHDVW